MSRRKHQKQSGKNVRKRARFPTGGPHGLSATERAAEAKRAEDLREEFERRKRQQIARAALELDHVDAEILRLHLTHPTITHQEIADILGLNRRQTVGERINAPKYKRAFELANRSALEIFQGNQARAARVLGELLGSHDERIRIRAAVAHMWPLIHDDQKSLGADQFVAFIQEAFERAQKGEPSSNSTAATTDAGASAPEEEVNVRS